MSADNLKAEIALILLRERIRQERERRSPVNQAGRALHGLWRSIMTGGWE